MKVKLKVELEINGYSDLFDFETERAEMFGFLIAELEEGDNCFLVAVDDRIFVSESVEQIIWFIEANFNQIDKLINEFGKSPEFDSMQMILYVEECVSMERAYDLAKDYAKKAE